MMFEAYVTNLGMYPERGVEVGEYLKFPTTIEEVQALFSRIGIDGKRYEEYFITDYQSNVLGLYDHLGEYESLGELNFLAHLLEEMTPDELEKLEAVMDAGEYTGSVKDLINLTQNLDCFEFYPGVKDEEELGRMYILEFEALTVPSALIFSPCSLSIFIISSATRWSATGVRRSSRYFSSPASFSPRYSPSSSTLSPALA